MEYSGSSVNRWPSTGEVMRDCLFEMFEVKGTRKEEGGGFKIGHINNLCANLYGRSVKTIIKGWGVRG